MKVFDSGQDVDWSGSGYEIYNGTIKARTGINIGQHKSLDPGDYEVGVICKNVTGNGLFKLCISDGDDGVVLDERIKASSGGWSTFNSQFKSHGGLYFINIYRDNSDFGTIEIGKIFIKKVRSKRKIARKSVLKNNQNKDQVFIKNNIKIAVIVPYRIFGGAEVYIREYFKKSMNMPGLSIVFLYFGKNNMQESLSVDNVFHKTILSEEHLKLNLKTNNYTSIIFYNSYNIYNILNNLKKENFISSNVIEIYHSDFEWNDSISSHKLREGVDRIIRVSSSLCNDIEGISNDKIITIPMGIDLNRFKKRSTNLVRDRLKLPIDKKIIGTVSRLSDEKNIDYIISLSLANKDHIFLVVGDGPKREYLKEKARITGSAVKFIGYSSEPEFYYNSFDAFILPSKMEGVPISIMEAMASEKPVFCNNVGQVGDLVEDSETGFFLTMDPKVDIELIVKNLKNEHIINKAKQKIMKKYNLEANFDRFINAMLFFGKYYEINKNNFDVISGEYV